MTERSIYLKHIARLEISAYAEDYQAAQDFKRLLAERDQLAAQLKAMLGEPATAALSKAWQLGIDTMNESKRERVDGS